MEIIENAAQTIVECFFTEKLIKISPSFPERSRETKADIAEVSNLNKFKREGGRRLKIPSAFQLFIYCFSVEQT